jgi:DNA-binding response OmpR family regulator
MIKILVIEDEPDIADSLNAEVVAKRIRVLVANTEIRGWNCRREITPLW